MGVLLKVRLRVRIHRLKDSLTFVECQAVGTHLPIDTVTASSTSSTSSVNQVFDLLNPWCASGPVPQIIRIYFNDSIYLTQLRVKGNSVNASVLFDTSEKMYQNNIGFNVSSSITYLHSNIPGFKLH